MNKDKRQVRRVDGRRLVSALVTALLIGAVLLCLTVAVQVKKKGYASLGGYSFFRVVTGSMEPQIPVGAMLISQETDIEDLKIGDIICFSSLSPDMYGRCITHRVIGISEGADGAVRLLTKGDDNAVADAYYVTAENLIGRAVWWSEGEHFVSSLHAFFSDKVRFLACVAFPCLAIAGLILRNCVRNVKRDIAIAMKKIPKEPSPDSPETDARGQGEIRDSEYQEMCARIRAELLEELKQEYDREQSNE